MYYLDKAAALQEETISHRRYFHKNAESGLHMPLAQEYVLKTLAACGIAASRCGGGVIAEIGHGNPCILLRADMDALPMTEESGLDFSSVTGNAHTCGHDLHAAMLLTAAKLLKENKQSLPGRVKLMFQPGEETLGGARQMIADGLFADGMPDAALALHVGPSGNVGDCFYNADSTMMLSCDAFRIEIKGSGGHGAYPHHTLDALGAAVQICTTLRQLQGLEADPSAHTVLTIGSLQAGTAYNVIPDAAVLQGSIRTDAPQIRKQLVKRLHEIAALTAKAYRCKADVIMLTENPMLVCDAPVTNAFVRMLSDMPSVTLHGGIHASGSDDYAEITSKIPSAYLFLSAGYPDKPSFPSHHPAVRFNEDVLPLGAAIYAHCSDAWLRAQ